MSWFLENASRVALPLATDKQPGLRKAQLGAGWALGAAFMSGRPTVAMAVLPTGTGKSTVLALVPLLVASDRPVLIATPSRLVRDQLADMLRSQTLLKNIGVLPDSIPGPKVHVVQKRLGSVDAWVEAAANADVVIGTMGVLSPAYSRVEKPPRGLFNMVLVDEAHHTPARTWTALLEALPSTHRALVTATPVRADGKEIQAELVYSYALADALRDGVIAPVTFVPVSLKPGESRDQALARAASERIRLPEHIDGRSLLLVRTGRIDDAKALVDVYRTQEIELGLVTGTTSPRRMRDILSKLETDDLHGLISVGVLGEGFDYPRIKVAVYHRKHQSLGPTLQFAGRVSRSGAALGPAELLAIRGDDVANETRELYESDSDWSRILAGLADAAMETERNRRVYLDSLRDVRRNKLLPEPLSAAALRPATDVRVVRLTPADAAKVDLAAARPTRLRTGHVVLDRVSDDKQMRVIVTAAGQRPAWITSDALDTEEHCLYVIVRDPSDDLVYVLAPSDSASKALLDALGFTDFAAEETGWIARFLNGLQVLSYYSVGMRATRLPGGTIATYRTVAGTSVARAVTAADSIAYAAGHLILQAQDPFNNGSLSVAVGVSMGRAKVWTPGHVDLNGFIQWCKEIGRLGRTSAPSSSQAPRLTLRIPQTLTAFPTNPLAAHLDSRMLTTDATILVGAERHPIVELDMTPVRTSQSELRITGRVGKTIVLEATIDPAGALTPRHDDPGTRCRLAGSVEPIPLIDAVEQRSQLTVYYADASSSSGNRLYTPPTTHMAFPPDHLIAIDWTDIDIRRESKPGRNGLLNVQQRMVTWHSTPPTGSPSNWVINDDGSGEIADLVVVRPPDSWLDPHGGLSGPPASLPHEPFVVTLSHCKYASKDVPRRDLRDLDEVVGQAHRSVRWLANPPAFWEVLARRVGGRAKVVNGDPALVTTALTYLATEPPQTLVNLQIVQPGLDTAQVSGWAGGETLLSFLLDAAGDVGAAVQVIGS